MSTKIKTFFYSGLLLVGIILITPNAFASTCTYNGDGTVNLNACGQTGGQGQDCSLSGAWFYKNSCTPEATIQSDAVTCYNNRRVFDGVTGCTNTCRVSDEIKCGNVCKLPEPENPTCTSQHRTTDQCTGDCGNCQSGYEPYNSSCVQVCPDGYQRGFFTGACVALDQIGLFEKLLDGIFDSDMISEIAFADKKNMAETIVANLIANPSYYFLTPTNADGTEYKYGSGGDPDGAVRLEADWSDSAWGAWYLDWDNDPLHAPDPIPGAIKRLIEGGSNVRLCATAADCEAGEQCSSNGACYTPGANSGTVCADDSDCNLDLFCNASGVCQDPYEGLEDCTIDAECTAPLTCEEDGYCHNMNNGEGSACTSNPDCRVGFVCGDDNFCHAIPGWLLIADGVVNGSISYNSLNDPLKDRIDVKVKWVGFGASSDGSAGGYAGADAACGGANNHVCTVQDILYLLSHPTALVNPAVPIPNSGNAWVNGGPPGYVEKANDCEGWKNATTSAYGRYWNFASKDGWLNTCEQSLPFACCRYNEF